MLINIENTVMDQVHENQFIYRSFHDMTKYSYRPGVHSEKKILTIIACHTNSEIKYKTVMNNIKYLTFVNNDIIIINSIRESHSEKLKSALSGKVKEYFEISNNSHLDIGKCCHVLQRFDYRKYDYVVFTNDSFIIFSPISHFFNKMINSNLELYGYNDSTQIKYHYQSYLFGVKNTAVFKLIRLYNSKKHLLNSYYEVVRHIELNLVETFKTIGCFLQLSKLRSHKKLNIFIENDKLYMKLFKYNLLPFVKLKRLQRTTVVEAVQPNMSFFYNKFK